MPRKNPYDSLPARLAAAGNQPAPDGKPRFLLALRKDDGTRLAFDLSVRDAVRISGALDQFLRHVNGPVEG